MVQRLPKIKLKPKDKGNLAKKKKNQKTTN